MGLRLTSHNFRHGQCSIQINDDPNCIEELAIYIGDSPETVRKYYAFLNRDALLNQMQDRIAERRSRHGRGRAAVQDAA